MTLEENVVASDGAILASKGQQVTFPLLQRLRSSAMNLDINEPIKVSVHQLNVV